MALLNPGYTGYVTFNGGRIRVTDGSIGVSQSVQSNPHVYGLRDNRFGDGKGEGSRSVLQNTLWRGSVKIVTGSFSFYATELMPLQSIYNTARDGLDCEIEMFLNCEDGVAATSCRIEQFSLSCVAGDLVQMSVSFKGLDSSPTGGGGGYNDAEKLITWDQVNVNSACGIESFSLTIDNPLNIIYTAGVNASSNLNPARIRIGTQSITGSITSYENQPAASLSGGIERATPSILNFSMPNLGFTVPVIYEPIRAAQSMSAYLGTTAFTAVDF